jgi:hypothetical protein
MTSSAIEIDLRKPNAYPTPTSRPVKGPYTKPNPWSYFFVEVAAEAREQKLDEIMVGYTYDIHAWSSDLAKRMVSSRYLMILKVNSNSGGRDIYKKSGKSPKNEVSPWKKDAIEMSMRAF